MEVVSAGFLKLMQSFPDLRELLATGQGAGMRFRAEVISVAGRGAVFRLPDGTQLEALSDAPLMVGDRVVLQIKEASPERVVLQLAGPKTAETEPAGREAAVSRPEIRGESTPGVRGESLNYWQIPVQVGGEIRWVQMEIDPEAGQPDEADHEPGVRFSLLWSGAELGRVRAEMHLSDDRRLAVGFQAESEETELEVARRLPELAELLEAAGLKPGMLRSRRVSPVADLEPFDPKASGSGGPGGRLDFKV